MSGPSYWLLLLVSCSVPVIFCRHDYQYYISKYHKSTSTSESSFSPGTSTTAAGASSTPGDVSPEENVIPLIGSQDVGPVVNQTILQSDPYSVDVQQIFIIRIVIIVGSVIAFVVVLGCIVCCRPKCCRGKERRGFVIRDNEAARPPPVAVQPPQEQTAVVQHFPPNYTQEVTQQFPAPPYQYPPQYQSQYSPGQQVSPNTVQFYNPPEAPPTYEDTHQHKY